MTFSQFLEALEKTPRGWRINDRGCIRFGKHCPISAVAGDDFNSIKVDKAVKFLGGLSEGGID